MEIVTTCGPENESMQHSIVDWLEVQTAELLRQIEGEEFWSALMSPAANPSFLKIMMAEVFADVAGYQPHVIEAAIAAIAQMPRTTESGTGCSCRTMPYRLPDGKELTSKSSAA